PYSNLRLSLHDALPIFQQAIRQFAGPDPAAVLANVNRLLLDRCPDDMFVTVSCAVVTPWDGSVLLANAGHPAPLRWDHRARKLADRKSTRLNSSHGSIS